MSRDHYKGIPKKVAVLLDADGNLEELGVLGKDIALIGTATITGSTAAVISGTNIKSTSGVLAVSSTGALEITGYAAADGSMTVSGTGTGGFSYLIIS